MIPGASGRELALDGPLGRPSLRFGSSTSRVSYDVAIRYTTDQLGAMLERLDDEVFDNTLIIVTSDHGEEIFDHQGFGHSYTLFEEVVRVPLLVKAAGRKTAHVHSEIVSLVDIYPTVLEATAIEARPELPGRARAIDGSSRRTRELAGADRPLLFDVHWLGRAVGLALLLEPYKLIDMKQSSRNDAREFLLFDLAHDQREKNNLLDTELERARDMRRTLNRMYRRLRRNAIVAPEMSEADLGTEALRALGYLD